MPVEGLPATLECMLNSALKEMTLSSFKVEGRTNQTVVVIRLTSKNTACTPNTAVQCTSYRRKCPSQVSRDRRRAEVHRTNRERNEAEERVPSPSGLFLPTPPSLFYATGHGKSPTDVLMNDNRCPSSSRNCYDEQQIDMTQYDSDRQTVTISYDKTASDQLSSEIMGGIQECDCDDVDEMRKDYACEDVDEVKVCDNVNEVKEHVCEGAEGSEDSVTETVHSEAECSEHVSDSCAEGSEITYSDVLQCIEKLTKKIDDFQFTKQDVKHCNSSRTTTVPRGNPYRDVS